MIDFGIAKVLDEQEVEADLPATRVDAQMYTPDYASPEQVRGEALGVGSDVYSLGVLLYELLTGRRPYEVSSHSSSGIESVVCHTIPAEPSKAAKRSSGAAIQRRQLRGDLDRIVMTALRKDPQHRFRDAAALADDIGRYLDGLPVQATGTSVGYRLGKFLKRHPGASIATSLTILTLAVALVVTSIQGNEARRQADRAEAAKQFLEEMIARSEPFGAAGTMTLAAALKESIPTISDRFSSDPLLEAEMRRAVGFALTGQGETELAREQLDAAWALYENLGSDFQKARAKNDLAIVAWDESDYERAEKDFEEALGYVESVTTPEGLILKYDILTNFVGLLPNMDKPEPALELSERAMALFEDYPELEFDPLNHAVMYNNRAHSFDLLEDYDSSITSYERSIELHRELTPSGSPDMATALANLALTYELVDRMDLAVEYLEQAVEMQRELLGPTHRQYLAAVFNLGSMQYNAGDTAGAIENIAIAVVGADEAFPPNHLYTGRFNHRLAEIHYENGNPELAAPYAERASVIYQNHEDVPERWVVGVTHLLEQISATTDS